MLFGGSGGATAPIRYSGLNVSSSELDIPMPVGWGQFRCGTNAIDYNDFVAHPVSPKGKGIGAKGPQQYDYTASVILALSRGIIDSIVRIFPQGSTTTTTTLAKLNMSFFTGTATQTPWSYMVTNHPTKARAYARTAYVATPKIDLGQSATIPDNQFECKRANGFSYIPTSLGWINPNTHVQDPAAIDCLMSDIIPDFLTNVDYGLSFQSGWIGSTTTFAAYQRAQGLSFSPFLNRQEKATQIIDRWANLCNTWIYDDGIAIRFVPLGDTAITANGATYTPDIDVAYALTLDDFVAGKGEPPVAIERKDAADCYNRTVLQICDRTIGYITNPFEYKDQTLVDLYGLRDGSGTSADEIKNPLVAQIVVQLIGKRLAYLRNTYKFKTSDRFILCLPGTILTLPGVILSLAGMGIPSSAIPSNIQVRVRTIDEADDGTLNFVCEEFPGNLGTYSGAQQTSIPAAPTGVPDVLADPGNVNTPAIVEPNSAFTGGSAKLVIAASGGANWGGCTVNISFDGTNYQLIGRITSRAPQGLLTANLASHVDPDTTNTLAVNMAESLTVPLTVTHADADALRTLSLVAAQPTIVGGISVVPTNGELLAFGTTSVTGTYAANLTYLRRGQYGTAPAAHSTGDQFTVIDVLGESGTSVEYQLPPQYIGQTVYVKLASFNTFGNAQQDLSTVVEYQYTPTGAGFGSGTNGVPATPTGLTATTAGLGQVTVSWAANATTDNVTGYRVYRATGFGASFGSASLIQTINALSYTDSGLTVGGQYTYFLIAVNSAGSSANTTGVNATAGTGAGGGGAIDIFNHAFCEGL